MASSITVWKLGRALDGPFLPPELFPLFLRSSMSKDTVTAALRLPTFMQAVIIGLSGLFAERKKRK